MAKSINSPPSKQKSLFSFFSKKPSPAAAPKSSSASTSSSGSASAATTSSKSNNDAPANTPVRTGTASSQKKLPSTQSKLLSKLTVGTRLAVLWPDDNEFYPCIIDAHRPNKRVTAGGGQTHVYTLRYDDGDIETVDLATERFRIIGGKKRSSVDDDAPASGRNGNGTSTADDNSNSAKKRRRIMEESEEEEMESSEEEDGNDSASEYKVAADDSMDDESLDVALSVKGVSEDDWLNSDDEVGSPQKKKKVIKNATTKKVIITRVGGGSSAESRQVSPTPMKPSNSSPAKKSASRTMDFSEFSVKPTAATRKAPRVSLSPMPHKTAIPLAQKSSTQQPKPSIPKPIKDVVNPAGTHLHNHLEYYTTNRKDLKGRPPSHPDFDSHTLYIDHSELNRVVYNGKKPSPAQKQWWEIKSQYADVILLFKVGKFYEMYQDDADVGVTVLGHVYMKGVIAHSGFPEAAYGTMLSKLVDAGYKVARVEQTETKPAFEARKKSTPKGKTKPQVMCREVCGIVTKGTRTFCYLEDSRMLEKGEASTGPLVSIKETLVESDGDNGDDSPMKEDVVHPTEAKYEYGVTVVDAITGVVTLGQFADDVLRSRLQTLLASFGPSEVLYEGGQNGSKTLLPFLRTACPNTIIEPVKPRERFPKSTAVAADIRQSLDRGGNADVKPWDADETVRELHRRGYYPRASKKVNPASGEGIGRWPEILRRCIEGGATMAISSFGAALFYLQRNLIDAEILSMRIVKAYAPPNTSMETAGNNDADPTSQLEKMYDNESRTKEGLDLVEQQQEQRSAVNFDTSTMDDSAAYDAEASIDHMALDGTTISNLEILHNLSSGSYNGSLLSKIDATQSPHGSRLLRAWMLRPMFRRADIDRRADAVEELAGGSAAVAMADARVLLKKTGDIERLLSRVHSMGGGGQRGGREGGDGAQQVAAHPNERAVLYETDKNTKRKVGDFSKLLNGLRAAADIPELFENTDVHSPMLSKIVRTTDADGCFPSDMRDKLDWFFDNFDLAAAAKGQFEPARGMDEEYDAACDAIEDVKRNLEAYKEEMCSNGELTPRQTARSSWKYINTKEESKDKYLIELPVSVSVPEDFYVKAKRGKGQKQVNKYGTPTVEQLVQQLEQAIEVKKEGKAAGMKLVFAKFDSMRSVWMAATQCTSMLDALGSLAQVAVRPGFTRPQIMDCPPSAKPGVEIVQGRHPCVDSTHSGGDFIPNDLILGSKFESDDGFTGSDAHDHGDPSVLLLSGPNMGGKSTLLRQTCLISILAQIGSFVPAERCTLTPVDRIFTRLGASDRILCGQSTFFVELAETAAAVRGATRRSLVIMDELGRGTSTFDGTSIASATVKHLVERNRCLALFATHYHSLLEDWKDEPTIQLGHMECIVEGDDDEDDSERRNNITFLYTLGDGPCPKSFGVNVARLAGLPDDVLQRAKRVSSQFEAEMNGDNSHPTTEQKSAHEISNLLSANYINGEELKRIWAALV